MCACAGGSGVGRLLVLLVTFGVCLGFVFVLLYMYSMSICQNANVSFRFSTLEYWDVFFAVWTVVFCLNGSVTVALSWKVNEAKWLLLSLIFQIKHIQLQHMTQNIKRPNKR